MCMWNVRMLRQTHQHRTVRHGRENVPPYVSPGTPVALVPVTTVMVDARAVVSLIRLRKQ